VLSTSSLLVEDLVGVALLLVVAVLVGFVPELVLP
jgi:hypothetical protein